MQMMLGTMYNPCNLKTKPPKPKPKYEPGEAVYDIALSYEETIKAAIYPKPEVSMYNEIQDAKNRLKNRVYAVVGDVELPLRRKFGLSNNPDPSTAEELVEAIQQKLFVLPSKDDPYARSARWMGIQWRDPKIIKDQEGFNAAMNKLEDEIEKVVDEIYVSTPAEGLKSLRGFETFVEKLLK